MESSIMYRTNEVGMHNLHTFSETLQLAPQTARNTYMERTETSLTTPSLATWAFGRGYSRARCALTFDFLQRIVSKYYGLWSQAIACGACCCVRGIVKSYCVASYESGGRLICFASWKMETLTIRMIVICQHLAQQMEITGKKNSNVFFSGVEEAWHT